MKNRLLLSILALAILFMGPVFTNAQGITTVTATIVDPNGIPWAGATVQATLLPNGVTPRLPPPCNGQNASPCFVGAYLVGSVSSLGTFSMNLPDNGVLLPSGTTWQFTVSTNGAPAPLGTGPQLFTVTTAINCGTNTPATCTAGVINISAALGPVPALSFGGAANSVSLTPSTNQTIQASNTTAIPLTIKEATGTTSGQDFQILDSTGVNNLFSISNGGTTINLHNGVNTTIGGNGAGSITIGNNTGATNLGGRIVKVGNDGFTHITMFSANNDVAGNLTCAGGTVTKTFAATYTSTPTVLPVDRTTAGGAHLTAVSNTAFTVGCTGATDVVDYLVIGNPN
jgi:hypothetical protein